MTLLENLKIGGLLLFLGGAQFFILLIIAEAVYPGYNISTNFISDLGATCNPGCVIYQPSSIIFNSSVILLGILAFIGSYLVYRKGYHPVGVLMMIASAGAIGIGLFPETFGMLHLLVSGITFFFSGLSAIISYRISPSPMSFVSVALGSITLVVFGIFFSASFFGSGYLGLGPGGLERVMTYSVLIWVIGIGAHFMGRSN
jgi:hypothetical membrane protein